VHVRFSFGCRQGARRQSAGEPGQLAQLAQLAPRRRSRPLANRMVRLNRGSVQPRAHGSVQLNRPSLAAARLETRDPSAPAHVGERVGRRARRRARRCHRRLDSQSSTIESLPATMVVDLSRTVISMCGARYRTQTPVLAAARSGLPTGPRSRSWGRSQVGIRVPSAHQPAAALRPEDVGQRGRRP